MPKINPDKRKLIVWGVRIVLILVCAIVLWASCYLMYDADMLCYARMPMEERNFIGMFKNGVARVIREYKTWQGTYFSSFLAIMTSAFLGAGTVQLILKGFLSMLMLLSSLYLLCKGLMDYFGIEFEADFVVCAIVILFFSLYPHAEMLYHEVSIIPYSFAMALAMYGGWFALAASKTKKARYLVLNIIFSFVLTGCNAEVAIYNCFFLFAFTLLELLRNKKLNGRAVASLLSAVVFTLINVAAPGNQVRRAYNLNGEKPDLIGSVISCFIGSCHQVFLEVMNVILNPRALCFFLLLIVAGLTLGKKAKLKWYTVPFLLICMFMPVLMILPTILGYGAIDMIPQRCLSIERLVILMELGIGALYLGCLLKPLLFKAEDTQSKKRLVLKVCAVLLALAILSPIGYSEFNIRNNWLTLTATNLFNGDIPGRHRLMLDIYNTFEESPEGSDVVIEKWPENTEYYYCNDIRSNPDDWHNVAVRKYYNLNSVTLLDQ